MKVAVGVVAHEGADAAPVERWFCTTTDAGTDPEVTEAIVRSIDQHGARSVAPVDRIIGCPHEEGIDYPEEQNVRSVRSGPTVIDGAASACRELSGDTRFDRHAKAVRTPTS